MIADSHWTMYEIMRLIIALCILLFPVWAFSNIAHATGIYKWVDERGKVHYADKPRTEGSDEVDLKAGTAQAPSPNAAQRRERQRRLLNAFQEEREAARAEALKIKQRKAQAQRNCNLARDRLRNLRQAAYLYDLDKQGNRVILSKQERENAISATQAAIERWCK